MYQQQHGISTQEQDQARQDESKADNKLVSDNNVTHDMSYDTAGSRKRTRSKLAKSSSSLPRRSLGRSHSKENSRPTGSAKHANNKASVEKKTAQGVVARPNLTFSGLTQKQKRSNSRPKIIQESNNAKSASTKQVCKNDGEVILSDQKEQQKPRVVQKDSSLKQINLTVESINKLAEIISHEHQNLQQSINMAGYDHM